MPVSSVSFYDREAVRLCATYEALDPAKLYCNALGLLPAQPGYVLDVAAGSGRDAAWLAGMGHRVVAVEPSEAMRAKAVLTHPDGDIVWIDDSLPALSGVSTPGDGFAFILAAAVWMHLIPSQRRMAWRRLASLAQPGGTALVTIRHGPGDPERPMHPMVTSEEMRLAREAGFSEARLLEDTQDDLLGRSEISWDFVALRR